MSDNSRMSMSAIRNKMVVTSLVVAVGAGLLLLSIGGGVLAVVMVCFTTLLSSLISARTVGKAITGLRMEQAQVVSRIVSPDDLLRIQSEPDDVKALTSYSDVLMKTLDSRQKERQQLLSQIVDVEEQLKVIVHSLTNGDDLEVLQVQEAVSAMGTMNQAFSTIIGEIDELSSRTEERASISTQMSATTDAIADNINQYSSFVIETSSSIEEMTRSIQATADNIRALSVSTEQTVSSINVISASQTSVRDNAERSATAAGSVRTQAQQGLRSMAATMQAMQEIVKSNDESFESISRLSHHSARVGEFLSVIRDVVEQTNLLSLNASIIAAQAGERGRAFAVVAEEVRSLARRTSASTKEIEELVRNIQKETATVLRSVSQGKDKVKEGVKISTMANDALVTIEKSAEEASQMVARIAGETTEQAAALKLITEDAEVNLVRVQQITKTTESQQEGTSAMVNNLEHMRELAYRINVSAQEQAKGNRVYLKSVIEDNERTREIKDEALRQIAVVRQVVDAVQQVESLIVTNAVESRRILEGVNLLTRLIDQYHNESANESEAKGLNYE